MTSGRRCDVRRAARLGAPFPLHLYDPPAAVPPSPDDLDEDAHDPGDWPTPARLHRLRRRIATQLRRQCRWETGGPCLPDQYECGWCRAAREVDHP